MQNTASKQTSFTHLFKSGVKLGTTYEIAVHTHVSDSKWSKEVRVKTRPIPVPEAISAYLNRNGTAVELDWVQPKNLTKYLQDQSKEKKLHYK